MRTLNGSSVSAVIFARAVLPAASGSVPRYLRPRPERTSSTLRALEMGKGLARRVDRSRDDEEPVAGREGDPAVHGLGDPRDDRWVLHVGLERLRDRVRRVRSRSLRLRDHEAGDQGAERTRERPEVLVVEDPEDEDRLLPGEQLLQGRRG